MVVDRPLDPAAAQRLIVAGVNRYVRAAEQLAEHQRIDGRLLDVDVAADGRDADHLGVTQHERDGDGVVQAGVAVEDDPLRHVGAR